MKGEIALQIIKHYRNDKTLRDSFNALAEATFGLNFENWYQLGFWGDNYDPYSILEDGKIVANVSVNRTDMVIIGQKKRLYQLGTVMTDPEYRNRGYIRAIMKEVEKDIADGDGVYLFANDGVVEFYPKFGFVPGVEYGYAKPVAQTGENRMQQMIMNCDANIRRLQEAMEGNAFETACRMVGNNGLIFFYAAQFLCECVYYWEEQNVWAIAELEDGELMLHDVFGPGAIDLDAVIEAFGAEVKHVTLGFGPKEKAGWTCQEYHEEDSTFFVRGDFFRTFAEKKLRIPTLSHA
jgi:predicted N-acetyltransferase YhbS